MTQQLLQRLAHLPQWLHFCAVGGAAAVTHLLAVAALVYTTSMHPLLANVLGFLLAFGVSYNGHARLTFAASGARSWRTARRYFLVACLAFASNEALYAAALHWLPLNYFWSLVLVLLAVAAGTFVVSKRWAFRVPVPP